MSKIDSLIKRIESGRKTEGNVQTNSKGVSYKYVTYFLDYPTKWDAKLFEEAQVEVYGDYARVFGKEYDRINFDKTQIKLDYPKFKGSRFGKLSLNRLVIL